MCVRVAIGNVDILYSKIGIDQMPNFKTACTVLFVLYSTIICCAVISYHVLYCLYCTLLSCAVL